MLNMLLFHPLQLLQFNLFVKQKEVFEKSQKFKKYYFEIDPSKELQRQIGSISADLREILPACESDRKSPAPSFLVEELNRFHHTCKKLDTEWLRKEYGSITLLGRIGFDNNNKKINLDQLKILH